MASFAAGMNPAGVYNAPAAGVILSDAGQVFALGDQVEDSAGSRWQFVSASTSISSFQIVAVTTAGVGVPATATNIQSAQRTGIAQNAISSGSYGWVQIYGACSVNVLSTCSSNTVLYATATAGSVDDSGTVKIGGLYVLANATVPATLAAFMSSEPFAFT